MHVHLSEALQKMFILEGRAANRKVEMFSASTSREMRQDDSNTAWHLFIARCYGRCYWMDPEQSVDYLSLRSFKNHRLARSTDAS